MLVQIEGGELARFTGMALEQTVEEGTHDRLGEHPFP
jgi:hypothetical protein